MNENWTSIGKLWRARGIRGELTGELDSQEPGREEKLKEVALELGGRRRIVQIEETWRHGNVPVFKFQGIDTMTDAELWEGAEILVRDDDLLPPQQGEYSHAALMACAVVEIGSGNRVGLVKSVEEYGGPPTLKVITGDGKEILIPFARSICRDIDTGAKVIRVELPEGLLDLQ